MILDVWTLPLAFGVVLVRMRQAHHPHRSIVGLTTAISTAGGFGGPIPGHRRLVSLAGLRCLGDQPLHFHRGFLADLLGHGRCAFRGGRGRGEP